MEYKEKVAWLHRYQQALQEQNFLREELQRLRSDAAGLSVSWEGGRQGGVPGDRMGRSVARILEGEKQLQEMACACMDLRIEVVGAIARVPNADCRNVLRLRYLEGKGYPDI
ncbi:MAG: hypothetical protein ACI4OI_05935, partial [Gemmiger sp.]